MLFRSGTISMIGLAETAGAGGLSAGLTGAGLGGFISVNNKITVKTVKTETVSMRELLFIGGSVVGNLLLTA